MSKMSTSDFLSQYLDQGEQILFFSDNANVRQIAIAGIPMRAAVHGAHDADAGEPLNWSGKLAVTECRIYLVQSLIREAKIAFEAMLDFAYAKQRIESLKAKWEEAYQHKSRLGVPKFEKDPKYFYPESMPLILTSVNMQNAPVGGEFGLRGGEYLLLNTHTIHVGKGGPSIGVHKVIYVGKGARSTEDSTIEKRFDENAITWGIRLKEPLNMTEKAEADTASLGGVAKAMEQSKSKSNINYEPILQVLQVKAGEISKQVKELEDSAL
jgi:hypothetical protein